MKTAAEVWLDQIQGDNDGAVEVIELDSILNDVNYRDRALVLGISNKYLQGKLLREDLNLDKILRHCQATERAEINRKLLLKETENKIDFIEKKKFNKFNPTNHQGKKQQRENVLEQYSREHLKKTSKEKGSKMAQTSRIPVFGSRPPCAYQSRLDYRSARLRADRMERSTNKKSEDFVCYDDSDEEESTMSLCTILNSSYNIVDYIRTREYGMREYHSVNKNHWTRHMLTNNLYKEQYIPLLETMDKVFCSQWLSNKQIIFGTKCNKIMVYNVNSRELDQIPLIKGRIDDPGNQLSGIHSLKTNQSRSLLATGAYNSNEIAVYRLPTLDPIVLAEGAHKDRVYDIEWLDNEFFVSGSRDSGLALWRVQDQYEEQYDADGDLIHPVTQFLSPKVIKRCKLAERVRVITFNKNSKELAALSLNGYVHIWDVERFKQRFSRRLPTRQDTICMSMKSDSSLYAIGCRPYVLLLDSRMLQVIKKVPRRQPGSVMRSLSFQDDIMTIGTSVGVLLFYDIRAGKFLVTTQDNTSRVQLRTSPGYACPDGSNNMENGIQPEKYTPAIYTHCYDFSGTRLFSAGGPLSANMSGNYAGLWQ